MRKRVFGVTAGLACSLALIASPAQAAALEYDLAVPDTSGATSCQAFVYVAGVGQGCFHANDELFLVGDFGQDGRSTAVYWKLADGSRQGIVRNKLGYGHPGIKNKSFGEGQRIGIKLGTCDQTASNDCRQASDYRWLTAMDWATT